MRQADAMETYFEQVVETLCAAGYRWYETANFCLEGRRARGRDLRASHNLGYWRDRTTSGSGSEPSRPSTASVAATCPASPVHPGARGRQRPPRELEPIDGETSTRERLMLGLRLDEPVVARGRRRCVDRASLTRSWTRSGRGRRERARGGAPPHDAAGGFSAAASPPSSWRSPRAACFQQDHVATIGRGCS